MASDDNDKKALTWVGFFSFFIFVSLILLSLCQLSGPSMRDPSSWEQSDKYEPADRYR